MIQSKWWKLSAAAFLSIGILSACGDNDDEDITPEKVPTEGLEDEIEEED